MTILTVNTRDTLTILKKRGLEPNGRVQKILTNEIARHSDKYTPFNIGTTKNTKAVLDDAIIYNGPYSRFIWYGKVMVGIESNSAFAKLDEEKRVTETDLKYNGAPVRGKQWVFRMWQDKKDVIIKTVADAAGGNPN